MTKTDMTVLIFSIFSIQGVCILTIALEYGVIQMSVANFMVIMYIIFSTVILTIGLWLAFSFLKIHTEEK
jgi:hypothetical protein